VSIALFKAVIVNFLVYTLFKVLILKLFLEVSRGVLMLVLACLLSELEMWIKSMKISVLLLYHSLQLQFPSLTLLRGILKWMLIPMAAHIVKLLMMLDLIKMLATQMVSILFQMSCHVLLTTIILPKSILTAWTIMISTTIAMLWLLISLMVFLSIASLLNSPGMRSHMFKRFTLLTGLISSLVICMSQKSSESLWLLCKTR